MRFGEAALQWHGVVEGVWLRSDLKRIFMTIYNLFPLLAGTFSKWDPHLERARDLGFDWVFVNPIHYPGFSGSLYSVKDYFRLNHLLVDSDSRSGGVEELKAAIAAGRARGLRFMVDLVINHCAFDSELLQEQPSWFHWEGNAVAHPFCFEEDRKVVWADLAKFNHRSNDQEAMIAYFGRVIDFLAELGFEGFRCDAAYQIPGDFWRRLIDQARAKHANLSFLAETLGCSPAETAEVAQSGFDAVFNSSKWWDFHGAWLMEQYHLTREIADSVSFPESHDTERLFQESGGNIEAVKQRYFFSCFYSAGVMMPMGFDYGFRRRLHVVETRPEHWEEPSADLSDFVRNANRVKLSYDIFQTDSPTDVLNSGNDQILYLWKGLPQSNQEALLILNKDVHSKQHFYQSNLYDSVQSQAPLKDVSPEFRLDYLPTPFEYTLRPGQGILLVSDPSN